MSQVPMFENNVWLNSAIEWMPALMQGAVVTLQISVGAFLIGLVIGLAVALVKLKAGAVGQGIANSYTTICRSVPELLLILLLYYAGSDLINQIAQSLGYENLEINGFAVAVVVLGMALLARHIDHALARAAAPAAVGDDDHAAVAGLLGKEAKTDDPSG